VDPLLSFETFHQDDLVWHVVTGSDDSAFNPVWPGLWEGPWPEEQSGISPWFRFAINNQDGEPLAVWRSFAWAMTSAPVRAALPRYDRDQVTRCLDLERDQVTMVRWEYSVDYETHPFTTANKGFEPARSSITIRPEPDQWERDHKNLAGLYEIAGLDGLHRVDLGVSFDVASELSLFGIATGSFKDLRIQLDSDDRPRLAQILSSGDSFAHLTVVRDRFLGHHSYFALAAMEDRSERIAELVELFSSRWRNYLGEVDGIKTHAAFAEAMDRLLADVP
jgi:hypothetical protein